MELLTFRVQRGLDQRWYVSQYASRAHSFSTQPEAEAFAKRWAKANEPSIVHVVVNGQTEKEWKFGEKTPGIQ